MDRQQTLGLYTWRPANCFRHPEKGIVDTTIVGVVHPRDNGEWEVRACEECVMQMEQERWVEAGREGVPYEPGHAGERLTRTRDVPSSGDVDRGACGE